MDGEGKGEVSACGSRGREDIGIGDLGFRGDVAGASGSEEEIEIYTDGEEVDIMVGFLGSDVVFDGVYGVDGQQDSREEEFRNFELQIEETLEIKEEEGYELYESKESDGAKSDEIVSCVRALVKSLPLPGQISPLELMEINPQFALKHSSDEAKASLKRKHESEDVKNEDCGGRRKNYEEISLSSMSKRYQEFEDFLISSTKYLPADKVTSRPQELEEIPRKDQVKKSEKQHTENSETELPHPCEESNLFCPVKDIKDSYWTDMVIETTSPVKIPAVDTMGSRVSNSLSTRLSAEDSNNDLRKKNVNYDLVPLTGTTDKYSPAELILTFVDTHAIPSESKLNNIFKRFGTLRETETVIDQESNCARVVFKRSSDAEVAASSAKAFNILGSSVVSYDLGYTPLLSYRAMPGVNVDNSTVMMQIAASKVTNSLESDPKDTPAHKMQFEQVEETYEEVITLETEDYEGLDDVDIMT